MAFELLPFERTRRRPSYRPRKGTATIRHHAVYMRPRHDENRDDVHTVFIKFYDPYHGTLRYFGNFCFTENDKPKHLIESHAEAHR